jgi:hypothetical protein
MTDKVVLREYLLSLGFDVSKSQERKFNDWLDGAKKAVLGFAAAFTAAKIWGEFDKISAGFEKLYYQSKRLQTSVGGIKSFEYAVSQLGGSIESANASIEGLGRELRENPKGIENFLKSIGVQARDAGGKLRDARDILIDTGKQLRETYKTKPFVAREQAKLLGIDEKTFQAIINPDFEKKANEQRDILKSMGVDPEKMAEQGAKVEQILRKIGVQFEALSFKLTQTFGPVIEKVLGKFSKWFEENENKIVPVLEKIGELILRAARAIWDFIKPWATDDQAFDKMSKWIDGLVQKFKEFVDLAGRVYRGIKNVADFFGIGGAAASTPESAGATSGADEYLDKGAAGGSGYDPNKLPTYTPGKAEEAPATRGKPGGATPGATTSGATPAGKASEPTAPLPPARPGGLGGGSTPAQPKPLAPGKPVNVKAYKGKRWAEWGPKIKQNLMRDFGLTDVEASAILGNLGHESAGFASLQEAKPMIRGSRGGWGIAQWTGKRRREFEAWVAKNGLDPSSYEANYGFLKYELENKEKAGIHAVKQPGTLEQKTVRFEQAFERAGIKHYENRFRWAKRASGMGGALTGGVSTANAPPAHALGPTASNAPIGVNPSQNSSSNTTHINSPTKIEIHGAGDPVESVRLLRMAESAKSNKLLRDMQGGVQ